MFLKIGDNQGIEGFHHKSSCVAVQIAGHALTDFQNVPAFQLGFYDERHLARYQIQDISQARNALQSNRYTNFNNLFTLANTDELFSKTFENDGDERSYHSEEFDDGFETNQ